VYLTQNAIALASGLIGFALGSMSHELQIFRGVATAFFSMFILMKWIEI